MGNYLNPSNEKFLQAVNSEIYVDKSELIRYTNKVLNAMQQYFVSAVHDVLVSQWRQICSLHIIAKDAIPKSFLQD